MMRKRENLISEKFRILNYLKTCQGYVLGIIKWPKSVYLPLFSYMLQVIKAKNQAIIDFQW